MLENNTSPFAISIPEEKTEAAALFFASNQTPSENIWQEQIEEGELAVDVVEADNEICIIAPMAGTKSEDIELHLHNDVLTIRGKRLEPVSQITDHFYQECFWGNFSRTIVLPAEVRAELATSSYKNGVLTVRLPKIKTSSSIPIVLIEE